jgi:hypothetical protein
MRDIKRVMESKESCAHQYGDLIQFKIPESDFKSNSEFRTTLPSN